MATRLADFLHSPISIRPLAAFRVAFGLLMFFSTLRFVAKGWVQEFYIDPMYHFTYWGFGWVKPLPAWGMYAVFGGLLLCSACIALGLGYRWSMGGFFLLFTYVELLDKTYYLNHYYFVSLLSFLLLWLPLNRAYSLDVWRKPALRLEVIPRWAVAVIQLQLGLVYFFAGLAKLNPDWLFRAMPLAIWLPANADFPLLGPLFDKPWFLYAMSWAGMCFDLTIPFWLGWRRSRPLAYLAVIGFHVLTGLLFAIGMFPTMMIVCTLIFFDERDWGWIWGKLRNRPQAEVIPSTRALAAPNRLYRYGVALFFALQVGMCLRHWAYAGNVLWTEEGYRFSWRVMLSEKAGFTTFFLRDPATGREWTLYPSQYLTRQQEQQMSFQPDMILSFAHFLHDRYQREGRTVEVRAEAYVSWNGRSSQLLIDPTVDLAQQPIDPRHKAWILPP